MQEIDLRIGASFTRFQTLLLRDAFVLDFAGADGNIVLSYGPCQVWEYNFYSYFQKEAIIPKFTSVICVVFFEFSNYFNNSYALYPMPYAVSYTWFYCGAVLGNTIT